MTSKLLYQNLYHSIRLKRNIISNYMFVKCELESSMRQQTDGFGNQSIIQSIT